MRLPMSILMQRLVSTTTLMRLSSFLIHLLSYAINLCKDVILRDFLSAEFFHETV